nr:HD domain-containing protein [Vicinamibacterales bacterium]
MPLSSTARVYLVAVIASGSAALGWSILDLASHPPASRLWLALLALTCFSSTFSIRIPKASTTVSVSETFVFLAALLYGPSTATVIIAVDGLVISVWRRYRLPQLLFNAAGAALSIFVAAQVFRAIAGTPMGAVHESDVLDGLLPFAGFTLAYFVLNSGLNSAIAAMQRRTGLWSVWRRHFGVLLMSYCGSASVAALLVYNSRDFDISTIAIVLPLLVITYFTFKTSLQRVEDANHHLEQMNRLYLSTIETLAMAVDATDQITHGHIRRVQTWAVGLARALGVTEESQLKAIEAAALLHDVGKLAIPEHILNKPGRLSPAEFEKMKRHAAIGADILSAIDFPYPVVPIVRHHHEQWNGAGYPEGLRGADIPIGARILSVVDCFDALTSDRPYRRALTDERAIEMLVEQRGRAYDPLVVDTFARVFRDIAPAEAEGGRRGETMKEIAAVAHSPAPVAGATPRSAPVPVFAPDALPLAEVLLSGTPRASMGALAREAAETLLRLTPASLCVIFAVDDQRGTLVPVQAAGEMGDAVLHHHITVGERLTGWVAANQRSICNSDASLDFVDRPDLGSAFRSCLSVPL